ncbi:hypothetical protein EZV62_001839 [Acer yangbiense]|uniref:Uncharacterized protein n=1 Tax=Acer yangbiense TaxID=1000413 RepID=A0A5C7IVB4_9ROSI|nr:hypothetical protein EZV62_001839 [Acer yangbiense]
MKRQVIGEGTYGVVYKAIDDTKEGMKTTAFWDWFLIVIGFVFFLGFLFTAVISKLLPVSDNLILSAIQNDSNDSLKVLLLLGAIDTSYRCSFCIFPLVEHEIVQACLMYLAPSLDVMAHQLMKQRMRGKPRVTALAMGKL